MAFERIEGQERAVGLLRRALDTGRVAHAYAFVGPPGSGRTTTALAFAAALLCDADKHPDRPRDSRDDRGACRICAMVEGRRHPDVHVVVPTPPASNPRGGRAIRIDAIRELGRQASLRPVMGRHKVFVLDDAERMTEDAPQAFLKTLEEPPARTVIVLVLPRAQAVPATVLSRCQIVRFVPRESVAATAERAAAFELFAEVRDKGPEALFRRSAAVDRARAESLVDAWWLLARDLVLARVGAPARLLVNAEHAEDIAREAGRFTDEELRAVMETCRAAREALATNVTPRLTVEVLLSRLALGAA
ncbi:MAG: ATP-binding protein [Candidatus Rokuibacteriota bacterium]